MLPGGVGSLKPTNMGCTVSGLTALFDLQTQSSSPQLGPDDDDETFRISPAAQGESLDNATTSYSKNPRLTLSAYRSRQLFATWESLDPILRVRLRKKKNLPLSDAHGSPQWLFAAR